MKIKLLLLGLICGSMASCVQPPPTVYRTKHTVYVKDKYVKQTEVVGRKAGETVIVPSGGGGYTP